MNKARFVAAAGVALMAACLSAGALTLHDSEGFVYTTSGEGTYSSVCYYPINVTVPSAGGSVMVGDGILFYNPTLNAVTIVVFENNATYGWSLQGHWSGNGCTFYGSATDGWIGSVKLYLD